jgi:L-ascorbate metabolism protein UlaG (beta-lactamase superfamily)
VNSLLVGKINLEFLGHASFKIIVLDKTIYFDPYVLPDKIEKADLILITHDHYDHCDESNVRKLLKDDGIVVAPSACATKLPGLEIRKVKPGEKFNLRGIEIEAVHAYNPDKNYHPKNSGVGYVITIEGRRIYHAGDTGLIQEMKDVKNIDVALLPIGGTYTMDVKEAARAANLIKPKTVVPMHYNTFDMIKADPKDFEKLVDKSIEVKIL